MFIISLIFLLVSTLSGLTAEPVPLTSMHCTLDLPAGYEPVEITESRAAFATVDSSLHFQIKTYPGKQFTNAQSLYDFVKNELAAEGDESPFIFNQKNAIFANLSFRKAEFAFSGYCIFINDPMQNTVLLSFTDSSQMENLGQFVLSALDSFQDNTLPQPAAGPVSQFIFLPGTIHKEEVILAGKKLTFTMDKNCVDIARDTIKREYSILTAYAKSPDWSKAWQRFYRLVFNDNYAALYPLAEAIKMQKEFSSLKPEALAALLLKWLQEFPFSKAEPFSDFTDPLTVITGRSGDCDSKALVFVILTRYLGIDSILLVSPVYNHALAGVDVKGKGARFPFGNKQYLIAELIDKVELGLIASDMADPANWLPIAFNGR